MKHAPTPAEQGTLDHLLERFQFEAVTIRLTRTMLKKKIVDARASLRYLLAKSGLVEYAALPLGAKLGVQLTVPLVKVRESQPRRVRFYRPKAKRGDPRFWISGLSADTVADQLLVAAFADGVLVFLVVDGDPEGLREALAKYIPERAEARRIEAALLRIEAKVRELSAEGWIRTLRPGDTGIGFTFEARLGIAANVRQDADLDGVEIKTHRTGRGSRSNPLVTLFAKTPVWGGIGGTAGLVARFGYDDEVRQRRALYCSIKVKPNRQGWSLEVAVDLGRVNVCHAGEPVVYYTLETLRKRLREKHSHTLFIAAQARGSGNAEEFHYTQVVYYREPSLAAFIDLVLAGHIGLDFAANVREGVADDRGYLWRIRERHIPALYSYQRRLL